MLEAEWVWKEKQLISKSIYLPSVMEAEWRLLE